ncbi:MAG: fatty acyl-AMP ligase [Planctomycetia bacterium 21-64-5]|nr:MAG: fatty acyl-AMP ligase [Planctomycetia bacterium 21-64-5]HQU42998.1 aminotransferase class I/II-fold pyridoxal phosphate-dependent enzyme [Pirellulales bacterium]
MDDELLLGSFFGPPTLVDLLQRRARQQGPKRAYTFLLDGEADEASISYAELDRQARAVAAWLQSRGLEGERALLLFPAGLEFIAAFFGCLYAGVVAVPAYPPRMNRSLDRIQVIAQNARAQVALTTQSVLDRVRPVLGQTPDLERLAWLDVESAPAQIEESWRNPGCTSTTLAFLQYTSGSTGTPKGVMLNHANLLHNCALISHAFEMTRSVSGVFWLPSYHDMGLVGGVLCPLYQGAPNIIMSPMSFLQRPFRWLQAISRYQATVSGGPNFAYDLCVRKITPEQRATLDLSSWGVAFNGAEPVRSDTLDRFAEMFEPCGFRREAFYPCYGLAEATLIVSGGLKAEPPVVRSFDAKALENRLIVDVPEADEGARRLVGSGQVLTDVEIVIADPEAMVRCGVGQVGEIWVRDPSVAQGYWHRPEETEHAFRACLRDTGEGPFLRTGDLGFFQDGELFVAGRLKDLIIIRGLNHYPHDIELTVEKSHTAVRPGSGAAFTIDVDDDARLVIVYEVERRQQSDLEEVFLAIRRDVGREHELLVDTIVLIKPGSIPKTSSGKIQRHACRGAFLQGALEEIERSSSVTAEPAAAVDGNSVDAYVASRTAAKLPESAVRPEPVSSQQPQVGRPKDAVGPARAKERAAAEPAAVKKGVISKSVADQVLAEVQRIAKERARGLSLDSSIVELGLDSLERMEILASLEERFGGRFPEEVLPQLETCREVVEAVEKYLGSGEAPADKVADDGIPPEHYRFDRYPEYLRLKQNLEMLEHSGVGNPYFNVHERVTNDTTMIGGRELINFSSYNYIGMSGDPLVAKAAKEAIDRFGTSVSASRVVSGEKTIHRELETAIAGLVGAEDAIVYVGGHSTNETTIGHLFGPGDLILHDALAHNSIIQGCILSGARRRPFPHNDWATVDQLLQDLRGDYRRVLIAIEGTYSMDGDIPNLPRFIEVKKRHKAFLMIDEAHSAGVLGKHGRGIGEYWDVNPADVDLWMGTLSKSFGSCGGYIAGCKAVVEYLKYTAPGFVYSVGISPSNAAAALASIELLQREPRRVARLHDRARLFLSLARKQRLNTGLSKDTPIIPIILGDSIRCLQLSQALGRRGINVQPIVHPAVEERAARLRFFITSCHTEEQIRSTVAALAEELARLNSAYLPSPNGNGVPAAPLHPAQR